MAYGDYSVTLLLKVIDNMGYHSFYVSEFSQNESI